MNDATRNHYRLEAQSYERTALRAAHELNVLQQMGDAPEWKVESLKECLDDARKAAGDLRRLMAQ